MNACAERNRAKRKRVANFRRGVLAGGDACADAQAVRREDVTLLAVGIFDQRNARGAIRIVFDPDHFGRDAVLAAFEIDHAVMLLVATADVARSQPTNSHCGRRCASSARAGISPADPW